MNCYERISNKTIEKLVDLCENYIIILVKNGTDIMKNEKRSTLLPRDIETANKLYMNSFTDKKKDTER